MNRIEGLERRVLFAGGDLDGTFGSGGIVRDNVGGYSFSPDNAIDVAVDSAHRVVVLGSISDGPEYGAVLRRYLPSGHIDTSFGGGDGKILVSDNGSAGQALAVQGDGKIIVVGQYRDPANSSLYPVYPFGVYRFNADGSVDTSFGGAGEAGGDGIATAAFSDSSIAVGVAIHRDTGKIVVVGSTQETPDGGPKPDHWTDDGTGVSTNQIALARFNADGTPDITFNSDGKVMHRVGRGGTYGAGLAVQGDGKIVVAGNAFTFVPTSGAHWVLLRFDTDGALDDSFGGGDGVLEGVDRAWPNGSGYRAVAIDAQNRILAGGADFGAIIARYEPDGSPDMTFGDNGVVRPPVGSDWGVIDLALDAAGNILAGGGQAVARLTPGGLVDTGFGDGGAAVFSADANATLAGLAVQADNKTVAAYQTSNHPAADFLIARYDGGPGDGGTTQQPVQIVDLSNNPFPEIIHLESDQPIFVTQTAANEMIYMPRPTRDGSVNLAGTEQGEQIAVEPVLSLAGLERAGVNQRAYFSTSVGVIGVHLAYVNPTLFGPLVAGHEDLLAQAKATLAAAQGAAAAGAGVSDFDLARAQRNVEIAQAGVARMNALKQTLAAATEYIRYRLGDVYEMYVAMSGQTTDTSRIRIDAKGGNDTVAISSGVSLKATIAGGWGADKLTSGRRRTLLMGGGGADRLISRSSIPSVLDGGHGADKFYTRFSACEVLARRGDGDCLITAAAIIPVEKYGTFGFADENSPTPGKCFYLVNGEDGKPADVLA